MTGFLWACVVIGSVLVMLGLRRADRPRPWPAAYLLFFGGIYVVGQATGLLLFFASPS